MSQTSSDRIKEFFTAYSRDITPPSIRHNAKVLYIPVSEKADLTRCCESVLSTIEIQRAQRFSLAADRQLFLQRRAFRRFCGSCALDPKQNLSHDIFQETENGRPFSSDRPDVAFSFSSCRSGFLGAWSMQYGIGVDIEVCTKDPGAAGLAKKYFSVAEARSIQSQCESANLLSFFQLWCLKEAALKSIGEGLPYGLSAFEFKLQPIVKMVCAPPDYGGADKFSAHIASQNQTCIAIVLRNPRL